MKGLDDIVQNVGTSLSIKIYFFIKHLESNTKTVHVSWVRWIFI